MKLLDAIISVEPDAQALGRCRELRGRIAEAKNRRKKQLDDRRARLDALLEEQQRLREAIASRPPSPEEVRLRELEYKLALFHAGGSPPDDGEADALFRELRAVPLQAVERVRAWLVEERKPWFDAATCGNGFAPCNDANHAVHVIDSALAKLGQLNEADEPLAALDELRREVERQLRALLPTKARKR